MALLKYRRIKVGTYPIHRQELIDLWRSVRQLTTSSPLYTKEEMKALIDKWQSMDETVVFTNGCFDIVLHRGALPVYKRRHNWGHLGIGLNSDASVGAARVKQSLSYPKRIELPC